MNITVEKKEIEDHQMIIKSNLDYTDFSHAYEKTKKEYQKQIQLPGFRKGKAPIHLIEKKFKDAFKEDTIEKIAPDVFKESINKQNLEIGGSPIIKEKVSVMENSPVEFNFIVSKKPQVIFPDHKSIRVTQYETEVNEEFIHLDLVKQAINQKKELTKKIENITDEKISFQVDLSLKPIPCFNDKLLDDLYKDIYEEIKKKPNSSIEENYHEIIFHSLNQQIKKQDKNSQEDFENKEAGSNSFPLLGENISFDKKKKLHEALYKFYREINNIIPQRISITKISDKLIDNKSFNLYEKIIGMKLNETKIININQLTKLDIPHFLGDASSWEKKSFSFSCKIDSIYELTIPSLEEVAQILSYKNYGEAKKAYVEKTKESLTDEQDHLITTQVKSILSSESEFQYSKSLVLENAINFYKQMNPNKTKQSQLDYKSIQYLTPYLENQMRTDLINHQIIKSHPPDEITEEIIINFIKKEHLQKSNSTKSEISEEEIRKERREMIKSGQYSQVKQNLEFKSSFQKFIKKIKVNKEEIDYDIFRLKVNNNNNTTQ